MIIEPRPARWPWIIGLVLLSGTALGAGFFLNNNPAGGEGSFSQKDKGVAAPPMTVCLGQADAELGVAKLYPVVTGRVVAVVEEGKEVKKGDILLRLDNKMAELKLQQANADLEAAQTLLAQAEKLPEQHQLTKDQQQSAVDAVMNKRASTYQEYMGKKETKAIGPIFLSSYEFMVKMLDDMVKAEKAKLEELKLFDSQAGADIKRAQADVAFKKARVEEAEFGLRECNLVAPSDGTVLRVLTQVGESLGTNPMGPAIQFCPKGPKIIRAEVLQEWAYRVEKGQEVVIEDDTYAGGHLARASQTRVRMVCQKTHRNFRTFHDQRCPYPRMHHRSDVRRPASAHRPTRPGENQAKPILIGCRIICPQQLFDLRALAEESVHARWDRSGCPPV